MTEIYQAFNLPVVPVNWNNGYWLSSSLWETFDYIKVLIGDAPCILARPLYNVPPISTILEQFHDVRREENLPLVLHLSEASVERRITLIAANIPFVCPEQVYLPFIGLESKPEFNNRPLKTNVLKPISQQILFYALYSAKPAFQVDELVGMLDVSSIFFMRSVNQLQRYNLIAAGECGESITINRSISRRALYVLAKPHLVNPVRAVRYVTNNERISALPIAGETALSEYSMLAPPHVKSVASLGSPKDFDCTPTLVNRNEQVRVEFWRYSPEFMSNKPGTADVLSVVTSLAGIAADEDDPRLNQALDEAVNDVLGAK